MRGAGVVLLLGVLAPVESIAQNSILGHQSSPAAGRVLGVEIHANDADELRYYVLQHLIDRYAEERGIVAGSEEVEAYTAEVRAGLAEERSRHAERRADVASRLAAVPLPEEEKGRLEKELARLDEALELLGEPNDSGDDDEGRRAVGDAFIRHWKVRRALYRDFGGRVIYQQGGAEPLDAIRSFLEAKAANGDFEIADPKLEDQFWAYYRNDRLHEFMPAGGVDEARAFARPSWLREGGEGAAGGREGTEGLRD